MHPTLSQLHSARMSRLYRSSIVFDAILAVEEIYRVDPAVAVMVDVQNTLTVNALLRWASGTTHPVHNPFRIRYRPFTGDVVRFESCRAHHQIDNLATVPGETWCHLGSSPGP